MRAGEALVVDLEQQETVKAKGEQRLSQVLALLEENPSGMALGDRVAELSRAVRNAANAGALAANSQIVERASTTLRKWQRDVEQRRRLDDELRAVVDSMRSLEGINWWFSSESAAIAKLDKAIAHYRRELSKVCEKPNKPVRHLWWCGGFS